MHVNLVFSADPNVVSAVAEAHRLAYGHLFNPSFATETSQIDPLPKILRAINTQVFESDVPVGF